MLAKADRAAGVSALQTAVTELRKQGSLFLMKEALKRLRRYGGDVPENAALLFTIEGVLGKSSMIAADESPLPDSVRGAANEILASLQRRRASNPGDAAALHEEVLLLTRLGDGSAATRLAPVAATILENLRTSATAAPSEKDATATRLGSVYVLLRRLREAANAYEHAWHARLTVGRTVMAHAMALYFSSIQSLRLHRSAFGLLLEAISYSDFLSSGSDEERVAACLDEAERLGLPNQLVRDAQLTTNARTTFGIPPIDTPRCLSCGLFGRDGAA